MIGIGFGVVTSQGASAARQSRPASSSNTRVAGFSESLAATAAPADPPPTTITSYIVLHFFLLRRLAPILIGRTRAKSVPVIMRRARGRRQQARCRGNARQGHSGQKDMATSCDGDGLNGRNRLRPDRLASSQADRHREWHASL